MSIEEKIKKLSKLSNENLLEYYVNLATNFNPVDFDRCETYDLVKITILERMQKGKKGKKK